MQLIIQQPTMTSQTLTVISKFTPLPLAQLAYFTTCMFSFQTVFLCNLTEPNVFCVIPTTKRVNISITSSKFLWNQLYMQFLLLLQAKNSSNCCSHLTLFAHTSEHVELHWGIVDAECQQRTWRQQEKYFRTGPRTSQFRLSFQLS